jgi:hypothetical protein
MLSALGQHASLSSSVSKGEALAARGSELTLLCQPVAACRCGKDSNSFETGRVELMPQTPNRGPPGYSFCILSLEPTSATAIVRKCLDVSLHHWLSGTKSVPKRAGCNFHLPHTISAVSIHLHRSMLHWRADELHINASNLTVLYYGSTTKTRSYPHRAVVPKRRIETAYAIRTAGIARASGT